MSTDANERNRELAAMYRVRFDNYCRAIDAASRRVQKAFDEFKSHRTVPAGEFGEFWPAHEVRQ